LTLRLYTGLGMAVSMGFMNSSGSACCPTFY